MIQIKWVGPAILAVCSGAKAIRIWDLLEDESTALSANGMRGWEREKIEEYTSSKYIHPQITNV